jgi:hypothetical protein
MWTLLAVPPGGDVPSGFLPKRGLKLNLRKCMYSTITIGAPQKQQPIAEVCSGIEAVSRIISHSSNLVKNRAASLGPFISMALA